MRIAISSKSGCGNTTVSTLLSEKLGYKLINFTFRQLAKEKNVEFWEFCKMAESDDSFDRELDQRQTEMAMAEENCVLGSRLAIWMLKKADLKVYLTASSLTRAQRVFAREGGLLEERIRETEKRDQNDSARYERIYGINNADTSVADLVIETDDKTPEEIVELILAKVKSIAS